MYNIRIMQKPYFLLAQEEQTFRLQLRTEITMVTCWLYLNLKVCIMSVKQSCTRLNIFFRAAIMTT